MGGGFFINKTQSFTSSTATGVLSAPVDTAENDIMIGMLLHSTDHMLDGENNLDGWVEPFPTGWGQIYWHKYLANPPYTISGRRISLFFKMATSSDTAGTTYSFTRGTGWSSGKVWAATLTFRGIGAYGGSATHNLTNYARRWTSTRTKLFDSATTLAPRQSDNRVLAVHLIGRYGLAAANPTVAQSGNTWVQHLVVREGTLSSAYAVTISSTTGNPTTGVLQLPTIPMQRFTNGAYPYGYAVEYDSTLLELVTTENALLLDPLTASSTKKKKPLTEEQKLAQAAGRSRLFEYSKPQRSNLWLSTGNKYNKAKGYI